MDFTKQSEAPGCTEKNRRCISSFRHIKQNNEPCTSLSRTPVPPLSVYQRPMYGRRNISSMATIPKPSGAYSTRGQGLKAKVGTTNGALSMNKPLKTLKVPPSPVRFAESKSEPYREISAGTGRVAAGTTSSNLLPEGSVKRKPGKAVCGISVDLPGQRSARDRLRDNNLLKLFDRQLYKLGEVQTGFLQQIEALKGRLPDIFNHEFKFIGMVLNQESKLVVLDDYKKKLAIKMPTDVVADFKHEIQDFLHACLITIQDYIKTEGGMEMVDIEDRLEQEQAHRLSLLFDKMDEFCTVTDASEQDPAQYQKQFLDAKHLAEDLEQEMSELKKDHEYQMIAREGALKTERDLEIATKDTTIADLNSKIEVLQNDQEVLEQIVESTQNAQTVEQEECARLTAEINSLKDIQSTLTKKLRYEEAAHKADSHELKQKKDEIAKLQKELEESKKLVEDEHSRTVTELSNQYNEKELTQLKAIHEQTKKDNAVLEEALKANRKELEDSRAEVEKYKAQNKTLKEYFLLQKVPELSKQPPRSLSVEVEDVTRQRIKKDNPIVELKIDEQSGQPQTPSSSVSPKPAVLSRDEHKIKLMSEHIDRCEMVLAVQKKEIISLKEEVESRKQIIKLNNYLLEKGTEVSERPLSSLNEVEGVPREQLQTLEQKDPDQREHLKECKEDKQIPEIDEQSGQPQTPSSNVSPKPVVLLRHKHKIQLMSEHIDRCDMLRAIQKKEIISLKTEKESLELIIRTQNFNVNNRVQINQDQDEHAANASSGIF